MAATLFVKGSGFYTPYIFGLKEAKYFGGKRAWQRFESCLETLKSSLPPALDALNAVEFYDQSVQKSATELVELALADAIEEISRDEQIANETMIVITDKLKSAKLLVMFPDDILNLTKIDGLYDELDFEGTESLLELSVNAQTHHRKLQLKPQNSWIRHLLAVFEQENWNLEEDSIYYISDVNILRECRRYEIEIE